MQHWRTRLLWTIGVLLALATLLPLIASNEWWIRVFDFPRFQITGLLALTLGLTFASRRQVRGWRSLAAILGVCLAYQMTRMLPFAPFWPERAVAVRSCAPQNRLRVLVANVLQTNRQANAMLDVAREADADVALFLETDDWWAARLAALHADYPHRVSQPQPNTYGMLLFSRRPLEAERRFLIEDDVPSIHAAVRLASGAEVRVHAVHPRPPVPGVDTAQRDAELVLVGRMVRRETRPSVVMGDMNDVAWSRTTRLFQQVAGVLDPRIGRGLYPTFNAHWPAFMRWPLDHVFFTDDIGIVDFRRLPNAGSDHFPVVATLCHVPQVEALQEAPAPDAGERREAAEAIEAGIEEEREEEREEAN